MNADPPSSSFWTVNAYTLYDDVIQVMA